MNTYLGYFVENSDIGYQRKHVKTILNRKVSVHTENVKNLKWYNQQVVYDKRKKR